MKRKPGCDLECHSAPHTACSSAVVPRGYERHGGEDGLAQLVAHVDGDLGALLVPPVLDVRHRDVLPEGRRGNPGRDDSCAAR